jgi:tetratricopeptide (TPR) repeat protein
MRFNRVTGLLLFVCLFVLASGGVLFAQEIADGWVAYDAGRYDEAYDIFSREFRENPGSEDANFGLGLSVLEKGKLSHAVFAFERVLMVNPENQRARLELARAYYLMGRFELARENFAVVLDSEPPPKVRENIEVFLEEIKEALKRTRLNGYINLSLFHDDNVNYGPLSKNIDTMIGDLAVAPESQPIKAWGVALSLEGSVSHDIGEKQGWLAVGSAGFYQNWIDTAYEQEVRIMQVNAGFRKLRRRWLLDILANAADMQYGHEHLLNICGLNTVWLYSPSSKLQWISTAGFDYRDFEDSSRDAPYYTLGETCRYFLGAARHSLALKVDALYDDTNSSAYRNYGASVRLSGELNIAWDIKGYAYAQYRRTEYKNIMYPALQRDERKDNQMQYKVGVKKVVSPHWFLNASYETTDNESNFDLYDFDRNLIVISSQYTF